MIELKRPFEARLSALMDGLAESTLAMDDEALVIEAQGAGEDATDAAEHVRGLLKRTSKRYRQRLLRQAADEYQKCKERLSTRWVDLPDDPALRRGMLAAVFASHPQMGEAFLTVQHREFKELTDADVESCLAQLAELGMLDGAPKEDDEA